MSLQISVTIWAVICFAVLALSLNKLLYKPMLTLMDARRAKIEGAREQRRKAEADRAEAIRLAEEERTAASREHRRAMAASLEKLRSERTGTVTARRREHAIHMETRHDMLLQESKDIQTRLEKDTDALAAEFADRMVNFFTDDALAQREDARREQQLSNRSRMRAEQEAAIERITRRGKAMAELQHVLRETEWTIAEIRSEYTQFTDEQFTAIEQGVLDAEQKLDAEIGDIAESVAEELLN